MDDFVLTNLNEARNEWCSRLLQILTPCVMEGIRSIFSEAWKTALENKETDKYLMTFQNFLCRTPKWSNTVIEDEVKRIMEKSGCTYLEDLVTCVHIIQLKILTCVRVGNRQKKIDIATPKLNDFIHRVYIHTASKVYRNAYLFDRSVHALQQQKYNREFENIVEESIMRTIRDSIPTEAIVRAYLDESVEQEEEIIVENYVEDETKPNKQGGSGDGGDKDEEGGGGAGGAGGGEGSSKKRDKISDSSLDRSSTPATSLKSTLEINNVSDEPVVTRIKFNDEDETMSVDGVVSRLSAPKTIERLEELQQARQEASTASSSSSSSVDAATGLGEELDKSLALFDSLDFAELDENGNEVAKSSSSSSASATEKNKLVAPPVVEKVEDLLGDIVEIL